MTAARWATFDCYGTLIDWNGGVAAALSELWPERDPESLLARYHELEPRVQGADPSASYRDVLRGCLVGIAEAEGLELPASSTAALADSLPSWPVFAEVPGALSEARARGWRLAILSNTDSDLLEASLRQIGVEVEETVVASEIGSYKPAHGHWKEFFARTRADPARHVHVAGSLYHDIGPANELGLRTVFVNRLGEVPGAGEEPTLALRDLTGLPDALDSLVTV